MLLMRSQVNSFLQIASLALLAVASAPALRADTIFSNIDGGICSDPQTCGLPIAGSNTGNLGQAVAFTPSANYTVTSASAVLDNTFNNTTVNFFIYSNSGSFPNASLGELGSATLPAGEEGVFTANASTSITLLAGTQYWLVLTGGDNLTEVLWEQFALIQVPYAYTGDGTDPQDWMTTPIPSVDAQFAIYGTPTVTTPPATTPEPASAWLLLTGFGLGGLMYFRRAAWSS
jgi:hypothetical protein